MKERIADTQFKEWFLPPFARKLLRKSPTSKLVAAMIYQVMGIRLPGFLSPEPEAPLTYDKIIELITEFYNKPLRILAYDPRRWSNMMPREVNDVPTLVFLNEAENTGIDRWKYTPIECEIIWDSPDGKSVLEGIFNDSRKAYPELVDFLVPPGLRRPPPLQRAGAEIRDANGGTAVPLTAGFSVNYTQTRRGTIWFRASVDAFLDEEIQDEVGDGQSCADTILDSLWEAISDSLTGDLSSCEVSDLVDGCSTSAGGTEFTFRSEETDDVELDDWEIDQHDGLLADSYSALQTHIQSMIDEHAE